MQKAKDWLAVIGGSFAIISGLRVGITSLPKEWWQGLTPWKLILEVSILVLVAYGIDSYHSWLKLRFRVLRDQISEMDELASRDYVNAEISKLVRAQSEAQLEVIRRLEEQHRLDTILLLTKIGKNEEKLNSILNRS